MENNIQEYVTKMRDAGKNDEEITDELLKAGWKEKDKVFWDDFSRSYMVGKGITQRLMSDEGIRDKGV